MAAVQKYPVGITNESVARDAPRLMATDARAMSQPEPTLTRLRTVGIWFDANLTVTCPWRVSAGLKGGQSGRFRGEPHSRPVMPKAHHNLDRLNETTAVTGRVFFPPDMRLVHEQASRAVR